MTDEVFSYNKKEGHCFLPQNLEMLRFDVDVIGIKLFAEFNY